MSQRTRRLMGDCWLALPLFLVSQPPHLGGQTVMGRTIEDITDRPVAAAVISLLDLKDRRLAEAEADSTGRFVLVAPAQGDFVIEVERVGYQAFRSDPLTLVEGESYGFDFVLVPLPIGLRGLSVSVANELISELRQFGHTPETLGPRWIDRREIDAVRSAHGAADVIRWQNVPGLYVQETTSLAAPMCVGFWRYAGLHGANPPCSIIILNGVMVDPVAANQLAGDELEGIAVLTPMEAAQLYGTMGGVGAVVLWTRRGR